MNFRHNPPASIGDFRVVRKFLWWPTRIGLTARWLEWAVIGQLYLPCAVARLPGAWTDRWVNHEFLDQ